jgi:hypothetical protein
MKKSKKCWVIILFVFYIYSIIDTKIYDIKTEQGCTLRLTEPRWMYWIHSYTANAKEVFNNEKI